MSGRELYHCIDDVRRGHYDGKIQRETIADSQTTANDLKASSPTQRYVTTVHVGSIDETKSTSMIDAPVSLLVNGATTTVDSSLLDTNRAYRRKGSLMPPITEQDLRSTDLGHRDPVSVAQVFGADFASQYCVPFEMASELIPVSPFVFESAEKLLRDRAKTEELRVDEESKSDLLSKRPTVKMRVRRTWTDGRKSGATSSFDERSLTLPTTLTSGNFPSSSRLSSESSELGLLPSKNDASSPGCAQENPEFLKFQRSFISWIRSQTQCFGCAFILRSSENNLAVCRISEDQQLFADGFYCCGHDHLVEALGLKLNVTGSEADRAETQGPKTLDIRELDQDISSDLFYLAEQIHRLSGTNERKTPERKDIEASLCGIMTSSSFVTTLIIVHQSKEKREQELKALLPHMNMIGSLTASVCNLEEQRRLSHLSQMILDRTQRVLLNMRVWLESSWFNVRFLSLAPECLVVWRRIGCQKLSFTGALSSIWVRPLSTDGHLLNSQIPVRLSASSRRWLTCCAHAFSALTIPHSNRYLFLQRCYAWMEKRPNASGPPLLEYQNDDCCAGTGALNFDLSAPSTSLYASSIDQRTTDLCDQPSTSGFQPHVNGSKSEEKGSPDEKMRRLSAVTVGEISRLDRHTILLSAMVAPSRSRVSSPVRKMLTSRDSRTSGFQPTLSTDENGDRFANIEKDMNLLVRNITKEAKTLVSAEICSLFLLDRENKELVAEVFEKDGTSDEYLTEIRMPLSEGIVGHVARTGEMMNVADVYKHPNFYPNVDQKTGFVTRNVLCFPIKDSSGNLVGVAELCNKIDKPAFTRHDEQVAQTFAVYCAISISHCLLYRKLQEAHRRSHMAAELLVQGSTLSIAPEDILRLTVREIPPPESFDPDFNLFRFFPRSIGTGDIYVEAALSMFQELGLIDRFRIRRRTLARFLLMVQKGYREVPYHNWGHAFAVAHFCYLLLRLPTVQKALDELERLSLLVACLCHDIDHRGTTNSFQLQSKTPLAQLYSSEGSVLERHHFAQTVTILGMDECNIFDELSRQEYQTVLDNMREIILATDLVAHLRKVNRINKMVEIGFDKNSTEHHYLFMCLLMTASDLSDQTKDFKNSKIIADHIYKEFFSQGDLEKQMGNEPSEMMDREKACVPKIQLEFTDSVTTRVFSCISQILPELRGTYESVLENRRCWSALDAILLEEGVPAGGGLDYLRNTSIEQKVYERVKTSEKKPAKKANLKDTEEDEANNVNKGSSSSRSVT
ncbi:Phosphodiesterase [Aphelenchoides besseyi]|nr:Phosphodiesterase [Aphelenchoides besseyi]